MFTVEHEPVTSRVRSGMDPALVGGFTALNAFLAVVLWASLLAPTCGRFMDSNIAHLALMFVSVLTFGAVYWLPGLLIGAISTHVPALRSPRFWLIVTAALVAGNIAVAAGSPAHRPDPLPQQCLIQL